MSEGEPLVINLDYENTWEPVAVPEGEYLVRIMSAEVSVGKKGPYLMLRLDLPEYPTSKDMTHPLMLPKEGDDPKTINKRTNAIKALIQAVGMAPGPFSPEQLEGLTFYAYLVVEEDEEYGETNRIRKILKGV